MTRMTPQQCLPIPQFRKEVRWKRIGVWLAFRLPGCLHDMIGSRQAEGLGSFSFSCSFVSYRLMNIGDDQPPAQHAYSEDQMCSRDRIHNHKDNLNEGCDGMNTRPVSPCPTRVAPVVSSVTTCISSPTSSRTSSGNSDATCDL